MPRFAGAKSLLMQSIGRLFLVGTPIGNLSDITLRALETLKAVTLIAAEDTRQTAKLLARYEISTPTVSYHEHNRHRRERELLTRLAAGFDVALVTDAGMPLLSDPGAELVRLALDQGIPVVPIPGPSALTTAVAVSGLAVRRFAFEGFLPRDGKGRRRVLRALADEERTMVFFEAPHRLAKTLTDLAAIFGGDRPVAVCRELTKLHEEVFRGKLATAVEHFFGREVLGEITIVLAGPTS